MTDANPPKVTAYQMLGGETGINTLVRRFYELMDNLPEAYAIRQLHPANLAGSEDKLRMYLSGWLGGPQLYVERFGHPRLRARHLPFAIDSNARDQWLMCMRLAMAEVIADEKLRAGLDYALADLADHMRNKAD